MKALDKLMKLCPGRVEIEIDKHIVFGETASAVIDRGERQFRDTSPSIIKKMKERNSIIKIDALPIDKPMPTVEVYHYNFESAIKECLKQIEQWEPKNQ